jgi:hypothetical protein
MDAVSSETSVNLYWTIWHHISESNVVLVLCTFVGAGSAVAFLSAVLLEPPACDSSTPKEQLLYRPYERFALAVQD